MKRIRHPESGLYCESGLGQYQRETHIFLKHDDNVPIQICKSALEVAAFLGGYARAVSEYIPVIVAAVSLAPKNSPCYKVLDNFIYRHETKDKYQTNQEPELKYENDI